MTGEYDIYIVADVESVKAENASLRRQLASVTHELAIAYQELDAHERGGHVRD